MITVIAATNREYSKTHKVAKETCMYLQEMSNSKVSLLDLKLIDFNELNKESYQTDNDYANSLRQEYLIPAKQFVFIIPEYNGSFSGILKYFIDLISSSVDYKTTFHNKTAMLIGLSEGKAGNLRGLTQFASILMHMNISVLPNSLPISSISKHIDDSSKLSLETEKRIRKSLSKLDLRA